MGETNSNLRTMLFNVVICAYMCREMPTVYLLLRSNACCIIFNEWSE